MTTPARHIRRAPKPDDPRTRFLIELARALGTYGTSAHRLEATIVLCANELGLECHVFSTPTSVFISIEHQGSYSTYLSRINPGDINLSRLRKLDGIFNAVIASHITPSAATAQIKQLVREKDPYPDWLTVLAMGGVSACASIFLGGSSKELAAASTIGLTIGTLNLFVGKNREHARLLEFLAGLVAALIAALALFVVGGYTPFISILAGLIILLPGLTLTISMTELATRNVVSGSARLIGALMILLLLGFGVAVGTQLTSALLDLPDQAQLIPLSQSIGQWIKIPAALASATFFVILFKAQWSDAWAMILAVLVAYYSARFGVEYFGPELGVSFGAGCLGILGNIFARALDRPSAIVMLPGLLMLVPGSISFKSIDLFMHQDTLGAMQTAMSVFIIAAGLVVGLLVSNVLVPPRKVL
ncbi:MAG: threonine/serine exporter ThrE family protein [Phycisphaerales bacterium]